MHGSGIVLLELTRVQVIHWRLLIIVNGRNLLVSNEKMADGF